jgi:hypothetical protein
MHWANCARSQNIDVQVRHIGGEGNERGEGVMVHDNGNIFMVGTTGGAGTGNSDILLTCLSESLACEWSNAYGGANTDNGLDLVECPNGDVIVVGFTNEEGDYDGRIIRVNSSGSIIWDKIVGAEGWNFIHRIVVHPNGGFLCIGESSENILTGPDGWLIWIDEDGNVLQNVQYGGEGYDTLNDIQLSSDEFIFLTGTTEDQTIEGLNHLWVIKLNLNLEFIWEFKREDLLSTEGISLNVHDDLIQVGGNYFDNHVLPILCNIGNEGTELSTIFSDINADYYLNEIADLGFGFLLLGNQSAYGLGSDDAMIQQWAYPGSWMVGPTFGTPWTDELNCIFEDQDTGLYFAGTSFSETNEHDENVMLVYWPADSLQSQFTIETLNINCSPTFQVSIEELKPQYTYTWINNELRVLFTEGIGSLDLFDLNGKCVYHDSQYQSGQGIRMNESSGIFLARIVSEKNSIQFKVFAR